MFVNILQSAGENKDFECQPAPNGIDEKRRHLVPPRGTGIDPVDFFDAEPVEDGVDQPIIPLEHDRKTHSDGNGVGNVRKEKNRLEKFTQFRDRFQPDRNQKGEYDRNGNRNKCFDESVFDGNPEKVVTQNLGIVGKSEETGHLPASAVGEGHIVFIKGDEDRVHQGIKGENGHQYQHRGQV